MEQINIITIAILSTVFVGSMIWLKKSIQQPASSDEELLDELTSKREQVAAIPFLNQKISDLNDNENLLNSKIDDLQAKISLKDIQITKLEKDLDETLRKSTDLKNMISTLEQTNQDLNQTMAQKSKENINLNNTIKSKENQIEQIENSYKKDIDILNSRNKDLHESINSLENKSSTQLSLIEETNTNFHKSESKNSELKVLIEVKEQNIFELNTLVEKLDAELNNSNIKIETLTEKNAQARINSSELESNLQVQKENNQKQKLEFQKLLDLKAENILELQARSQKLAEELNSAKEKIDSFTEKNAQVRAKNSELESSLNAQQENNLKLKIEFEEQGKKLELKLNEIMQNNLDNKLKKFDETSMKSLDSILKPFKENIDSFKKKVEDSQENSIKKFAELSKEIEQVTKAGMNISKEADNLTKALKGKKQTQGSWGEMILESVLEYSGLLKDVHYYTQQSYKDEQGSTKRPDVIIKLPQERTIIIDSKVSLNDYENYIKAETEKERAIFLNNIVTSFKNHIDTLDSKDYAHYKIGTLQYVFMFVPIEGAFAIAVQKDPTLYEYALKKHIAIVNPSTLTVSLRTIYLYWQSEHSNSLTIKLFDEAGKLYDKVVGYAENFNKIGNQIKTLSNTYEVTHKQLSEGSGNILGRVENLKKLGAKASKNLKDSKIEFQDFDDTNPEVIMVKDKELLV